MTAATPCSGLAPSPENTTSKACRRTQSRRRLFRWPRRRFPLVCGLHATLASPACRHVHPRWQSERDMLNFARAGRSTALPGCRPRVTRQTLGGARKGGSTLATLPFARPPMRIRIAARQNGNQRWHQLGNSLGYWGPCQAVPTRAPASIRWNFGNGDGSHE